MAIPRYVQSSAGSTDATGAFTFTGVAGTSGNIVILHIVIDGTGAISWGTLSATNIEDLAGTDNQWTLIGTFNIGSPTVAQQRFYIGRLINASAPTFTASANTSGDDVYGQMHEYTDVSTGTTLATVIENVTAGSTTNSQATNATVSASSVTTLGPDRLALNFIGINDDNTPSSLASSGLQGWNLRASYQDSGGTDAALAVCEALAGSICDGTNGGTQSFGGSVTNEAWAEKFATSGALDVSYVTSYLQKTGTPVDDVTVEIQSDSGGLPSGSVVGSGATVAGADLSTTLTPTRVSVSASLSASTTYHLVWSRSGGTDAANFYGVGTSANILTNANFVTEQRSSGVWSSPFTSDMAFALQTSSDVLTGVAVSGGSFTQADATDGWGTVGFALIGTTVISTTPARPEEIYLQAVNRASVY